MWSFNNNKLVYNGLFDITDENYTENDVACLSNQGDLSIYSIMTLREQLTASALRREDIT